MKKSEKLVTIIFTLIAALAACAAKPGTIDWANKPDAPPAKVKGYLPSSAPEEQGMDSAKVEAWVKALDA